MDLEEEAIAHITKMRENAEALTEALGLPKEATYTVMAAMHRVKTSLVSTAQPATSITEEALKNRIFQLSEDFITTHMQAQLATFRTRWERLRTFPLEVLGRGLGQQPAASTGLGFAGSESLLPVVSLISWAVINQATFAADTSDKVKEAIAKEAQARGFPRSQSYALANYLEPRLKDN